MKNTLPVITKVVFKRLFLFCTLWTISLMVDLYEATWHTRLGQEIFLLFTEEKIMTSQYLFTLNQVKSSDFIVIPAMSIQTIDKIKMQ